MYGAPAIERMIGASNLRDLAKGFSEILSAAVYGWATLLSLITLVAVTPDGQLAVSGYSDKTLKVWELATGTEIATFILDAALACCAVFPGGEIIVVGDAAGTVHFLRFRRP